MGENMPNDQSYPGLFLVQKYIINKVYKSVDSDHSIDIENTSLIILDYLSGKVDYLAALERCKSNFYASTSLIYAEKVKKIINTPLNTLIKTTGRTKLSASQQWDEEEDMRLIAGILKYGDHDFRSVAEFVGCGRNRSQCSQRWNRTLDPNIKKSGWTVEEDHQLLELVKIDGLQSWANIARKIGKRTDVQCRYRFQQLKKLAGNATISSVLPSLQMEPYNIDMFLNCFE